MDQFFKNLIKRLKLIKLKQYIDMNNYLRKKAKNDFEKHFFKQMTNVDF